MSSPKWTPAQRAAIADRGGSLLVSAAAGSGKTAVLTERAVQLITDPEHPVDADQLLIVTFTNAAAAELRARIGQALLRLSQQQPGNAALRRQRMLLQRAPICTIDAFCLDLLHKHFQALDLPPDFVPADPGSVETLRAAALAETLEKAYEDPDFCAFADLYGKGRSDQAAGRAVLQVYDFLRAMPDYPRRLTEMLTPWQQENGFCRSIWQTVLLEAAVGRASAAVELLTGALADCQEDFAQAQEEAACTGKAKKIDAVKEKFAEPLERLDLALGLLKQVEQLARAGEWECLYDKLTPYVLGMEDPPGLKKMKKRLAGDHKTQVKIRADEAAELFAQIQELICCSEAEAEADRQQALPRLRALFDAVRDFDARFAAKKRERKMLEFSDFEHEALHLLQDAEGHPTPLCQNIRCGYAAVMVDEYQDTNALQDALYRCLASPEGDNLFLVGDLKQSIYRFRQAEPEIFRAKLGAWPALPGAQARLRPPQGHSGSHGMIALDANFRSAPQVVEGINFFFEQLMTPQLGDTAYGDGQRLVCGAPGEYAGSVEVCFQAEDSAETEAAWVARRIFDLVQQGEMVRDGSALRPVRYEDCCILLSARANFPVYAEALTRLGIPVYADARENLLDAPHIRPLVALLRVLDNPAQDVCLAAAMLGPLFGFTEDDLVRLRGGQRRGSLYGAVIAAADGDAQTPFHQKLREFRTRLDELRRLARSLPADRLMEEVFASTGYLAALGAMENGPRRREDAHRFAAFCASAGAGGISALVRAMDAAALAGSTGQDTVAAGAHSGCVSIMTIHRSKGLQFPVVILAETGRRFNTVDIRQPVLLHRTGGAGLRLRPPQGEGTYKTAAYTALTECHAQEMRSEQLRLLYVALTRAQDKLILTIPLGVTKTSDPLARAAVFLAAGAGESLHTQANCFADWLRAALLVHPCGGPLRRLAGLLELPFADTASRIELTIRQEEEQAAAPQEEERPALQHDPALTRALQEGFVWHYRAEGLDSVPAKVSVTSLVHQTQELILERPAFLSKDGLTAAEMGTALHAFMEHADFGALAAGLDAGPEALAQAVQQENQRHVQARLTSPEIAEKLDQTSICRFVSGALFARIRAAEQVLRELAFITALPADVVMEAQHSPTPAAAQGEQVLVQGVADLVLVFPDHLELVDYKTDRKKDAARLLADYAPQLELYALALNKRFAPRRVTYKGIYSFALGQLIQS